MTDNGRNEADRLRVILETLAFSQPELKLEDALPVIWEIEERTLALESPGVKGNRFPKSLTAHDLAAWIDLPAQKHIQDKIPATKINAIKDVRTATGCGLKEAKDGVEYWQAHYPIF